MAKILVIEDERDIRDKILQILTYEGFETLSAENGRIGVQTAHAYQPDLIICDILMPELNGYGVLTELRSDPRTSAIPFIFLTAKATVEDVRHGMSLGADDYLAKPFKISDLLDSIRVRLEKQTAATKPMEDLRVNLSRMLPHELQTPLTAILGFTEFLLNIDRTMLPGIDDILEMQRSIHDSAVRLQRLIQKYLSYAQLKLAEYDPQHRDMWQFESITEGVEPMIIWSVTEKANEWQRMGDIVCQLTDAPVRMLETHLQTIVAELVENACKFSDPGTPIEITSTLTDQHYLLTITDHGRGLSDEQIAQIGAYQQFDRQIYEQQGLGLGLTLVRMLTELHGGACTIASAVHQGTTVTVQLNLA